MRFSTVALGIVVAGNAAAQSPPKVEARYSPAFNTCMKTGDAARGVTIGMMNCLGTEIDVQDARLNQAYRMVMARQTAAGKTKLRASERQWIAERDAGCKAASDRDGGGTASALGYNSCILDETVKRVMWLERYKE